jgi:transposase
VFDRYVKLDRLRLTDAISVDEVFLDMDDYCKYALVIQDFHTGDPIDLLRSRRTNVTEPYFTTIPIEERLEVKYLISDMYNQYIAYVEKYFPNAIPVVDSFHVIQWIVRLIDNYIRVLIKKSNKVLCFLKLFLILAEKRYMSYLLIIKIPKTWLQQ